MKVLAVDTSSFSGSIALVSQKRLVAELTVGHVGTHSEWLFVNIKRLLEEADTPVGDIDLFAISVGPGSFTGLRIGVSAVKGLAWSLKRPVSAVSTLEALSLNAAYSGYTVCPVLDARKKEVYAALYRASDGVMEPVMEDSLLAPEALLKEVKQRVSAGPVLFLGNGLSVYRGLIERGVKGAEFAPEPLWHVRASNIARLALQGRAKRVDPCELKPLYLRKSEAELKRAEKAQGA